MPHVELREGHARVFSGKDEAGKYWATKVIVVGIWPRTILSHRGKTWKSAMDAAWRFLSMSHDDIEVLRNKRHYGFD